MSKEIKMPEDLLRRVLSGDDTAQREARKLLGTTKPTTGLLGRWAKHPEYGDVLIASEKVGPSGRVVIVYPDEKHFDGAAGDSVPFYELTFPEQTAEPEDVPMGEAWLVEIGCERFHAIKHQDGDWFAPDKRPGWWESSDITLVSPLVPSRPVDNPEFVETEEEYESLPAGTIVAELRSYPFLKRRDGVWVDHHDFYTHLDMAGTTCKVLRKGWVDE